MIRFPCPYLKGEVELTEERHRHIGERHPELLPDSVELIASTLADPDQVRRSAHSVSTLLFSRWYTGLRQGKHVVVVVVSDLEPTECNWIITAYMARKLAKGEVVWKRD